MTMNKTGDAKAVNMISDPYLDDKNEAYVTDMIHPYADKAVMQSIRKALKLPEGLEDKNAKIIWKVVK